MFNKNNTQKLVEHEEYLEDGKVFMYTRNGIFYARVYKGEGTRGYVHRSLKTRQVDAARKAATRFYYEIDIRKDEGLPLQQTTFNDVIDEYVRLRQLQYDRAQLDKVNTSRQEQTSIYMLRQIKRVVKFWREYCGKKAVDKIDNAVLKDYVPWRKDYYHRMDAKDRPKNSRLNPADKTIEWEVTLAKTLLKFADERGYRGRIALPTWRFISEKRIVRPAYTAPEMARIYKNMRDWIRAVKLTNAESRWNREMLCDYIHILAKSGMRPGEANNLLESDVIEFKDDLGRTNYQFNVRGKTGARVVIPLVTARAAILRVQTRNKNQKFYRGVVRAKRKDDNKGNWFFRMIDGNQVKTIIDQLQNYLKELGIEKNRYGEVYTLYSFRHFYAVRMLHKNIPVWDIARNMGTSVEVIEAYYGRSATSVAKAAVLGG